MKVFLFKTDCDKEIVRIAMPDKQSAMDRMRVRLGALWRDNWRSYYGVKYLGVKKK